MGKSDPCVGCGALDRRTRTDSDEFFCGRTGEWIGFVPRPEPWQRPLVSERGCQSCPGPVLPRGDSMTVDREGWLTFGESVDKMEPDQQQRMYEITREGDESFEDWLQSLHRRKKATSGRIVGKRPALKKRFSRRGD